MYHWVSKTTEGIAESCKNIIIKKDDSSAVDGFPISAEEGSRIQSVIDWCRTHAQKIYPSRHQVTADRAPLHPGRGRLKTDFVSKNQSNNKMPYPAKKLRSSENLHVRQQTSCETQSSLRTTLSDTSIECSRREMQSVDAFFEDNGHISYVEQSSTNVTISSQDVLIPERQPSAGVRRRRSKTCADMKRYRVYRRRSSHSRGAVCHNKYKKRTLKYHHVDSSPYRSQGINRGDLSSAEPTYLSLKRAKHSVPGSCPHKVPPGKSKHRVTSSEWTEPISYMRSPRVMVVRTSPKQQGKHFFQNMETRSQSLESSPTMMSKSETSREENKVTWHSLSNLSQSTCLSSRHATISSCMSSITSSMSYQSHSTVCSAGQDRKYLNKSAHNPSPVVENFVESLNTAKASTGPVTCLQKSYALLSDLFKKNNMELPDAGERTTIRNTEKNSMESNSYRTRKSPQKSFKQMSKLKRRPTVSVRRSHSRTSGKRKLKISINESGTDMRDPSLENIPEDVACTDNLEFDDQTNNREQNMVQANAETSQSPPGLMNTPHSALNPFHGALTNVRMYTSKMVRSTNVSKSNSEGELASETVHVKLRINTESSAEAGDTQANKTFRNTPKPTSNTKSKLPSKTPPETDPGLNSLHSNSPSMIQCFYKPRTPRPVISVKRSPPRKNITIRNSPNVSPLRNRIPDRTIQYSAPNTSFVSNKPEKTLSELKLRHNGYSGVQSRENDENKINMSNKLYKYNSPKIKATHENDSMLQQSITSGYSSLMIKSQDQNYDLSLSAVSTHGYDTNESRHEEDSQATENIEDEATEYHSTGAQRSGRRSTAWPLRISLMVIVVYLVYSIICMVTKSHFESCWMPMDSVIAWTCTKLVRAFKLIHVDPPPI